MNPKDILYQYWGYDSFRPQQEEIIRSVLTGIDTLALLPTGGGKSICFQVPALLQDKLCLVISPLIALMKDQVENLQSRGIKAQTLFSGQSLKEQNAILEQAVNQQLTFLYISPERLSSEDFRGWLRNMDLSLLVVDEAHCINQWGYDFRPEYLQIGEIREQFPEVPVLALTASATPAAIKDIIKSLKFRQGEVVYRRSFIRENLVYLVRKIENKNYKILEICNKIAGTGIIYTRNRRRTEELALYLKQNQISCDFYHAGLSTEERSQRQEDWIKNKTRIIVCTNAFGMGIDKPDVRFVIHYEPPDCIESYYQEAGRAGRDGLKAYCILCYFDSDTEDEKKKITEQFPDDKTLNKTYQNVCNYLKIMVGSGQGIRYDFDINALCHEYRIPIRSTHFAISLLQKLEYLEIKENGIITSTLKILLSPQELYKLQVANEEYNRLFLALLRTDGGYFDFHTPVNELKIALLLNITPHKVSELLLALHQEEYIDYQAKTATPQLSLLAPRFDKINPDRKFINKLQTKAIDRFESMNSYIHNEKICRNLFIAKYFGENIKYKCGKCDVCIENTRQPLSEQQFEHYRVYIKEKLTLEKQNFQSLRQGIKDSELREFMTAYNWMLSNNWIDINKKGLLEWKNRRR
ncbi:MAG: RecQ family ATP-dependent DNA helicase [Bacteroidia bacterium]|nr:RecQ family ATP-dependent DNA helicase [Bacteroidia bacterium]MCO5253191.1 RecQ family ATP-dependent DNA helicase [Bacteroidota bacterium]